MKKNGHRLLTLAALVGTAAGVIHIANRFIDATSQLKDMLEQPHSKTYDWRFGKIFYTKQGHGTPILLIHDIMPGADRRCDTVRFRSVSSVLSVLSSMGPPF